MPSLAEVLSVRLTAAFTEVAGNPTEPAIQRSTRADFQANGALALGRSMRRPPRDVATDVLAVAVLGDVAVGEVSGPGFINLTLGAPALWRSVAAKADDERLGVASPMTGIRVVVDYSQPNVAKEMHVGHLRSTVIGDALVRALSFLGADVIRMNHIGDWGTQFGMLIEYLDEHGGFAAYEQRRNESPQDAVARLSALYRAARAIFDTDPGFVDRARARVVNLQSGDPATLATWRGLVDESKRYFVEVYRLLDVELTAEDVVGESFYNPALPGLADELVDKGIAVESDGALCVFFEGVLGPDGSPVPLIVRKSDGGFGYAATDLAAIRHRVEALRADRVYYVVDARQALHFAMVFATAQRAGWLHDASAEHVAFGTVLGPDGKPFKTRSGETVPLIGLLIESVERATAVVATKSPNLSRDAAAERAHAIGIGAIKYADLANGRTRDYVFDLGRMLSLSGNTSVYLQYAHARARSILRKAGDANRSVHVDLPMVDVERQLAVRLDEFGAAVTATAETLEPHRLCTYLFELAQALSGFVEACPVLAAPGHRIRANRLALCQVTADTLKLGLSLLGIEAPERL
jgi:arginyl-tRNA synthetase